MRPRKGCQRCRERHAKCIVEQQGRACQRCVKYGEDCDFLPHYRFRSDVPRTELHDDEEGQGSVEWSAEQVWVPIKKRFKYVYENGQEMSPGADAEEESAILPDPPTVSNHATPADLTSDPIASAGPSPSDFHLPFDRPTPPGHGLLNQQDLFTLANLSSMKSPMYTISAPSPGVTSLPSITEFNRGLQPQFEQSSPFDVVNRIQRHDRSYSQSSDHSVTPLGVIRGLQFNRREVHLLHFFTERFAPLADICDPGAHFANEVPRRALYKPMILMAICAVASRFEAITSDQQDIESSKYHDRCLPMVIEALSAPEATYDEDLLVTVLLLRIHEEFSSVEDSMHHLLGANQMLNVISKFALSGGMGESASWQALRQIIYASIVQRDPLKVDLENYDQSFATHSTDDGSYGNAMILLCAKVLKLVYGPLTVLAATEKRILDSKIDDWLTKRPRTFYPLTYQRADPEHGRPFPEITVLNSAAVVGIQYYYVAKILLLIANEPNDQPGPGFTNARQRLLREKQCLNHLSAIIGLALSNDHVHNAKYTACHMLYSCGYLITNKLQREHIIRFLERIPRLVAWRTRQTIDMLKDQWRELDT
ncbi:fungal specific transcription factor domain-containing protein 44 [Elsinoe australis]|uniref:Fungal specific transcription factor domain-containing protein 44 n=1 Tax=Elsinoe australis TaxID=40998 RepID=A0A4U7AVQ7_9PEZI|nr:fungal specific transcription factor domain-containing protein 44 [Elsinoe australis]